MSKNPRYPLKHLSVRVPWHDTAWNGTICRDPKSNSACLALKNCAEARDDDREQALRGKKIAALDQASLPPCLRDSGQVMSSVPYDKTINHPYAKKNPTTHGHFLPTNLHFPAYSACTIPYRWMLKGNTKELVDSYDLEYDEQMEPDLKWITTDDTGWVQQHDNQKALLDCFYGHLEEETSLVFLYAKLVPFVEQSGRIITGIGRIRKIIPSGKYEGSNSSFASAYWETMVTHSIRPTMDDGFLLPYHAAAEYAEEHPDFDPADLAVIAPDDKWLEFSYAAEHVSNDTALRVLLDCQKAWEKAERLGIGENHSQALQWIHDELYRIQKMRGVYPGMGAALCSFGGIPKGHFVAAEIISGLEDDLQNPWLLFEKALDDPTGILSPTIAKLVPETAKKLYKKHSARDSRQLKLLHLLSRFDLSLDQCKRLYVDELRETLAPGIDEDAILSNPYLIFELSAKQRDPVALETIDLGLFLKNVPEDLLPVGIVSSDPVNPLRVRALAFQQLRKASFQGHTLLPRKQLVNAIRELPIEPKCDLNKDHFELAEDDFSGAIETAAMKDGSPAYQLADLRICRDVIRNKVELRAKAKPLETVANWGVLLDERLKKAKSIGDPNRHSMARLEKLAALSVLEASRISVLIGPAGTGKTTLLTALASHPEIKQNGVLLLAPTGKARVRMDEMARDLNVTVKTLAQYLNSKGRFDGHLQLYKFSDQKDDRFQTVILDEASMLTEEMLATTLDCLEGAKRFILVGDPRQLPPIGPGRPFVDVVERLRPDGLAGVFPKVGSSYAELSINMRAEGERRADLQLAEWFSGNQLEVGADRIINQVLTGERNDYLRVEKWKNPQEFESLLEKILVEELDLGTIDNISEFNKKLGSADGDYFNDSVASKYFGIEPSIKAIERWQILSPVRGNEHGVTNLNRRIHWWFRRGTVNLALHGQPWTGANGYEGVSYKVPKPVGTEQIVYGDKVINLSNHYRKDVYPTANALEYIANGEIGLVTGQWKTKSDKFKGRPQFLKVEFSSQKGFTYTFKSWDFKEEGDSALELAYALTVHKSQGSEFETVILVLPNPCAVLSREMLYTALTRQTKRVVLLHQGDAFDIKAYSSPLFSDTLKRITNLFVDPDLVEVDGRYLEKNLIHRASDGEMLRSKSELLIYQRLLDKGLKPRYERKLIFKEVEKLPDFTIENADTGEIYFWEHCGMMHDPKYLKDWEEKREWYKENEIISWEDGGGRNGSLIVTEEKPITLEDGSIRGAFSVQFIDETIMRVFGR